MELKQYQEDTLAILRRFLEDARGVGPKDAYEEIVRKPEQAARLGRYAGAYVPLEALPDAPYVCLRLPTGGGKTILAAHAVAVARDAWIEKDWPMVLWLVPTSTIRRQTVEALKSPRHPYRRALDAAFRDGCGCSTWPTSPICARGSSGTTAASSSARSRRCGLRYGGTQGLCPQRGDGAAFQQGSGGGAGAGAAGGRRRQVLLRQPPAPPPPADDRGRGAQRGHRVDAGDAGAGEPVRRHRVHGHAQAQFEHPAQCHGAGIEARGDDQAADHAGRARKLAERGERRGRHARPAGRDGGGRPWPYPPRRAVPGTAEEPGGHGRGVEAAPDRGRGGRGGDDRGRDRRPAGAGRYRSLRPELSRRARHHRRGVEGRLGLLLRLCLLFRLAHPERAERGAASRPGAPPALCEAARGRRS